MRLNQMKTAGRAMHVCVCGGVVLLFQHNAVWLIILSHPPPTYSRQSNI